MAISENHYPSEELVAPDEPFFGFGQTRISRQFAKIKWQQANNRAEQPEGWAEAETLVFEVNPQFTQFVVGGCSDD